MGNKNKHILEQDWVYFLRNMIIESVKCNGVSMHQNKPAAFPKTKIVLYKCNLYRKRNCFKCIPLNNSCSNSVIVPENWLPKNYILKW